MSPTLPPAAQTRRARAQAGIPPLEPGDHLTAAEFLRRYEAMPHVKKAELIQGIVYMAPPVRIDFHAEPDNLIQTWLGTYAIATRGVKAAGNGTVRLGPDDVPQPDGLLRILPKNGGRSRLDSHGLLDGPPELAVEIAATSASFDTREKRDTYRRSGVQEYVVWRTRDDAVDWWVLEEDEYRALPPGADGILRSRVFPGLWLDVEALLNDEGERLMAVLREGLQSQEHADFVRKLAEAALGR
jgi:Uma2 family endonuclease